MIPLDVVIVITVVFALEIFLGGAEGRRETTPDANLSDKEIATEDARRQAKKREGMR